MAVAVSVTPSSVSVQTGHTQQFTAVVTGTSNATVSWSASGGTISSSGMYTAPNNSGNYTVTATSMADKTASASAAVNVTAAPVVAVSISPTFASLLTGGTQQFTATVTGSSNTAVTWSANGGSVSSGGLYTAPSTAGTYTVKATTAADNTKSASAMVTITAPVQHSVTLTWIASTTVAGYNVYRGTQSGGPYAQINNVLEAATNYVDNTVRSGQTYYYVVTAVDSSGMGSAYSNQAVAVIPIP